MADFDMNVFDEILFTTVRIVGIKSSADFSNEEETIYSTGFFITIKDDHHYLVTVGHGVEECSMTSFSMHYTPEVEIKKLEFLITRNITIDIPGNLWQINNVLDIAILPIDDLFQSIQKDKNIGLIYRMMNQTSFYNEENKDSINGLEDIVVTGYPNSLSDEVNNMPISMRGITATHPLINFHGDPSFLVHIPVYEGSSGSPVFAIKVNPVDRLGNAKLGMIKIILLGMITKGIDIYDGNGFQATGNEKVVSNFAYAIKAFKILDFIDSL